tara:strand:+ start:72 stop:878 length:807 start_codon:yes stop_codon:yes gene_type:complete
MREILISLIKNFFKKLGYSINKTENLSNYYKDSLAKFIDIYDINLVLDIGAHHGSFSKKIRTEGYNKEIQSFEPGVTNFKNLKKNKNDNSWHFYNFGFGSEDQDVKLLTSARDGDTNSISKITKNFLEICKNAEQIESETVKIYNPYNYFYNKLDSNRNILLKIDTEGSDYIVLSNFKDLLNKVSGIYIECGFNLKMYADSKDYLETIDFLKSYHFMPFSLNPHFTNTSTGQLMVCDILFYNTKIEPKNLNKMDKTKKNMYPKIYNFK